MMKKIVKSMVAILLSLFLGVSNVYAENDNVAVTGEESMQFETTTATSGTWIQAADGRWWYKHSDGTFTKNDWETINGQRYYFDASGWMATGWEKIGTDWYYFGDNGCMRTGWQKIDIYWYYFGDNGCMRTDWQKIDVYWYYFGDNGRMRTGWCKINNVWYYMKDTGVMNTAPLQLDERYFTFYPTGGLRSTQLGVIRQRQEKSKWCWVASALMIGKYRTNSTVTQTQTVTYVKGSPINKGGTDDEVIQAIHFSSNGTKNASAISPLAFERLIEKIDLDRPFGIHMTWKSGGGHMTVGAGYDLHNKTVYTIDPWENTTNRYYNYANLINGMRTATGTGKCTSLLTY